MPTVTEIIRCLLNDLGSIEAAIRYAERIARAQWDGARDYAEAVTRLRAMQEGANYDNYL